MPHSVLSHAMFFCLFVFLHRIIGWIMETLPHDFFFERLNLWIFLFKELSQMKPCQISKKKQKTFTNVEPCTLFFVSCKKNPFHFFSIHIFTSCRARLEMKAEGEREFYTNLERYAHKIKNISSSWAWRKVISNRSHTADYFDQSTVFFPRQT